MICSDTPYYDKMNIMLAKQNAFEKQLQGKNTPKSNA